MQDLRWAKCLRSFQELRFALADLKYEFVCRRLLAEMKANFNPAQPRAPRGSPVGGRWIDGGSVSESADRESRRSSDYFDDRGQYSDRARFIPIASGGSGRLGVGGNRPPPDSTTMRQIFPALRNPPANAILAPIDNFLGLSAPGEAANLAAAELQFQSLSRDLRQFDPDYRPPAAYQSLQQMSWEARNAYIGQMRLERASALYKFRGQVEPLQIETLRFLQRRVDARYKEALTRFKAGTLDVRLGRNEAIGNYIDRHVRADMRAAYNQIGLSTAAGQRVRVNSREYDTSGSEYTYTVPDVRVGSVAFDITMAAKSPNSTQIRGFFRSDFRPSSVIIVRPAALGRNHTYLITAPSTR